MPATTSRETVRDMLTGGVTATWPLASSMAVGAVLLLSPAVLGWESSATATNHVVGALVLTASVTALAPVARLVRFLNAPLGIVRPFAPSVIGAGGGALAFSVLCGLALIHLAILRGPVDHSYGERDRFIR